MKLFIAFMVDESGVMKILGISKSEKYLENRYLRVGAEDGFAAIEEYSVIAPDTLKINRQRMVENGKKLIDSFKKECLRRGGSGELTFHHMWNKMGNVSPF